MGAFRKDISATTKQLAGFAAGAIGIRAGIGIFGELSDKFDRIGKLSNRFKLPVEDVQKLSVASELTGTNLERLTAALTKSTVSGVEAAKGIKTYEDAFQDLGIEVDEFNNADSTEKIALLSRAFANAKDESVAFTAAYRILGKAGSDLIPLLRENADGVERLTSNLNTLDAEDIAAIERFNDDMTLLKANLQAEIGKAFAQDLSSVRGEIIELASAVGNTTAFLVKHRGAVANIIKIWAAYKGIKVTASIIARATAILKSTTLMAASSAAIGAETAALAKNTAAQALNSKSRKSGAAGNLATSIGSGVGVVGKGAAILKKIFPAAAVAAIGYGTGRLFGDKFADAIDSGRLKAFDQINDPIDEILATTFDQIQASRTVADTEAAREKIAKNISSLQRNQLQSANEQERIAAEHAIAILKTRDRSADIVRERQKQLDIEKGISTELGDQSVALENQRFRAETAAAGREARAANEKKRTSEIREEINSLASEIRGKKFDLLPDSEKIKIFEKELADAFSRVAATGDLSRRLRGAESLPATSFDSEEDLQARIKEAQKDGNDAEVLNLAKELQKVQELNIKINALKKEQLERTKAETVEQERLAQVEQSKADSQAAARAKFAQDLALTKLRANGREEEAKALEKEIALRQEAQRLAVETGVTEEKALALLRQKAALEARGNAKPGGGFGDGRDIGLDSRFDKDGNRRLSSNGKRKKIVVIKRNKDGVRIDSRALAARKAAQKVKPEIPVGKIDRLIQLTEDANSLWGTLQSSS